MRILGISAYYHDAAAALIKDGEIIAAAQEERFTRIKNDASFPANAIRFCLDFEGIELSQIDAVVFYDKPLLKFERLLESYYSFAPRGISSFILSMPIWIKEKMFLKKLIKTELLKIGDFKGKQNQLLFPEHHLSHAASAFYPSPFEDAAILTIDGVGEWATASISHGKGRQITVIKDLNFPHSLGLLYSAFTYYLGFKVNSGEYKLMGLAPYGNEGRQTDDFIEIIKKHLMHIYDDGSIWLNQKYFNYAAGLRMAKDKKWSKIFGFNRKSPEDDWQQHHCNLALAIQKVTEEVVLKMAKTAKTLTGSDHLCLAGGVALNCVANGKLFKANIFKDIFIQPAAGDAGGALGAALAAYHISYEQPRYVKQEDGMKGAFLGPEFLSQDVQKLMHRFDAPAQHFSSFNQLCQHTAQLLADGKVIGWMQGRMEFGPRALGQRSILGDPRNAEMQKKLNLKIKYRESFRPFAPSVLATDTQDYFELDTSSPYMLIVQPLKAKHLKNKPKNFEMLSIKEKLYEDRSALPAITHVDDSARIQTVHKQTQPEYHQLLEAFKDLTGIGMLVNTSFNVRGEPIVCTPEDAYRCFMRTKMDYLVINNFIFEKEKQPKFENNKDLQQDFAMD